MKTCSQTRVSPQTDFIPCWIVAPLALQAVTNGSVLTITSTSDRLINTADGSIDWQFDTKPGLGLISAVLTCPAD